MYVADKVSHRKIDFFEMIFLLGVFMKQFYMRNSGSIQLSDILLFSASLGYWSYKYHFRLFRIDRSIVLFVFATFIINGLYDVYYGGGFLISSLYFLYNLVIIMSFRLMMQNQKFLNYLSVVMKINLLTQLIIFLSGMGRYYASIRYEGTFNDPNQFSFFVSTSFFILYLCSVCQGKRLHVIWHVLLGFFVIISTSSGMTLCFLVFIFSTVVISSIKSKQTPIIFCLRIFLLILMGLFLFYWDAILQAICNAVNWESLSNIVARITVKLNKVSGSEGIDGFIKDRWLMRIINAPYYFVFGSGEGNFSRFISISGERGEMHSTMLALCYYYGIIPYCLFMKWLYNNLKNIPYKVWGVFVALVVEAFTLANHRQPFFWMIFVLGSYLAKKKYQKDKVSLDTCLY